MDVLDGAVERPVSLQPSTLSCLFFFFNDTATTEIYTLSLHDALPICGRILCGFRRSLDCSRFRGAARLQTLHRRLDNAHVPSNPIAWRNRRETGLEGTRSEEHTSELQSHSDLVCRLLLEKKKKYDQTHGYRTPDPAIFRYRQLGAFGHHRGDDPGPILGSRCRQLRSFRAYSSGDSRLRT